jgi:hypothetical protein
MSQNASDWRNLTSLQRTGWNDLGLQIQRSNSLGSTYNMTGFMAYCMINNNNLAAGNAQVSDAPLLAIPDPLATITPTLTAASFSVAYTVTPLPAGARLFLYASPMRSAGRTFENDMRLISVTAAAAASPFNVLAAYQGRFGTPVTGSRIFMNGVVYAAGFMSPPMLTSAVVA